MDAVATYTAIDQEGQEVYWSLLTTLPSPVPEVDGEDLADADFEDNGHFSISADGVLTFNIPPDHERSLTTVELTTTSTYHSHSGGLRRGAWLRDDR